MSGLNISKQIDIIVIYTTTELLSLFLFCTIQKGIYMKKKIYIVLFIVFILVAGVSAYQLINDQVQYRASTDYYDSFADSWVKPNPQTETHSQTGLTADSSLISGSSAASVPSETSVPSAVAVPSVASVPSVSSGLQATYPPFVSAGDELSHASSTPDSSEITESPDTDLPSESPEPARTLKQKTETSVLETATDHAVMPFTTERPPISVDFNELKRINQEIVGWIYCEGTPINYPVMQAENNEKYLNALPDKRFSLNGSVFIDCSCESDFSSDNTLMYGHNRKTGMFACLPRFKNKNYYNAHSVMWLLTPDGDYKVIVFAGFNAYAESWVYEINFFKEKFRSEYVDRCLQSSDFKPVADPIPGTRLLTLSTCYYFGPDNGRYVVIGMLIPSVRQ